MSSSREVEMNTRIAKALEVEAFCEYHHRRMTCRRQGGKRTCMIMTSRTAELGWGRVTSLHICGVDSISTINRPDYLPLSSRLLSGCFGCIQMVF